MEGGNKGVWKHNFIRVMKSNFKIKIRQTCVHVYCPLYDDLMEL